MEKFRFRLDKVLEYREKIEDVSKAEYGKAKKNLDDEMKLFNEILSHIDSINCERDKIAASATIKDLRNYNLYLGKMKERLNYQKKAVEKAQAKVDMARNRLIASSIEKKTLENLKDRDFNNYLYRMQKEEEKIIDQVVSYKSSMR